MKHETYICDRCENEISGVVYTLTCYADDIERHPCGGVSSEVAVQNMRQNMSPERRHLCKACKDEITDGVFIL